MTGGVGEGGRGGHVFINNNDDKGLPVALLPSMLPLALFFFFYGCARGTGQRRFLHERALLTSLRGFGQNP